MTTAKGPRPASEGIALLQLPEWASPAFWPERIAVAVSGGGDSMALLHIVARIQIPRGASVHAVTVDHRLRPEAAEEARFVARFCETLGVAHDTLVWEHGAIAGNLQDQARRARYSLIGEWARTKGVAHVLLGHTADDQAETFLMGLAREAGIDGLSGMRRTWEQGGILWMRPCLATPRGALRAYLNREDIGWIEDPSNEDPRFQRVRARRALAALAPLGVSAEGLARVASNLALARADLVELAHRASREIARTEAGAVILDRAKWMRAGNDTRRRILVAALRWVSSAEYAPRAEQIARLEEAIRQGRHTTLAGCRVRATDDAVQVSREAKAVAGLESPTDAIWDGRWRLTGPHDPALRVRALGADGLGQCAGWRAKGLSRAVLAVTPSVWRGNTLVAAPVAGTDTAWRAEIVAEFPSALFSD